MAGDGQQGSDKRAERVQKGAGTRQKICEDRVVILIAVNGVGTS
jgi:hypothetical protein